VHLPGGGDLGIHMAWMRSSLVSYHSHTYHHHQVESGVRTPNLVTNHALIAVTGLSLHNMIVI
jgi:hypothetical protein